MLPGSQISAADAAGVVTTRAAAEAFFSAGTNRRMWRYTAKNYLCRDMEALKDTSRPTDRIRQDVNRSPGGDSEIFHTQCAGCHSGMDARRGRLRLLRVGRRAGAHGAHARPGAGEVRDQHRRIPGRPHHDRRQLDQSAGDTVRTPRSAGTRPSLAAGGARRGSASRSRTAARSRSARSRRCSSTSASGRRATTRMRPRSNRSRPSSSAIGATTCARCSRTSRSTARRANSMASHGVRLRAVRSAVAVACAARARPRVRRLQRRLQQRQRHDGGRQRLPRPLGAGRRGRRVRDHGLPDRAAVLRGVSRGQRPGLAALRPAGRDRGLSSDHRSGQGEPRRSGVVADRRETRLARAQLLERLRRERRGADRGDPGLGRRRELRQRRRDRGRRAREPLPVARGRRDRHGRRAVPGQPPRAVRVQGGQRHALHTTRAAISRASTSRCATRSPG